MRARRIIGGVAAVLAVAAPTAHAAAPFALTGYVEAGDARALPTAAAAYTDIGVDGATVRPDGAGLTIDPADRKALAAAHAAGRPASLLVSNFDGRIEDFSPAIAARLLRVPAHRAAVVGALAREVAAGGWDGVTVDLEALQPADRAGLTAFVQALRAAIPPPATLDLDLPAATSATGDDWRPFDVPALTATLDRVVVMAYDEHYSGGRPGPIAGLPWVRRVLATAQAAIPAQKLRMGLAGFGYRWRPGKPDVDLTDAQARRLAGARARWSAQQGEWHATLRDGSRLWWSDGRSVQLRLALFDAAGVSGGAVWRIGSLDRLGTAAAGAPPS
jgi:spore germination protein